MEDKINKFSPSRNHLKKQIKPYNRSERNNINESDSTITNNNLAERKLNPFWVAKDNSEIFSKKKLIGLEKNNLNQLTENSEILITQENNIFLTEQSSPTSVFLKNSSGKINYNSHNFLT